MVAGQNWRVTAPTLFLHIGRNKVGSTTLQAYFERQAGYLRQAGFDYVFFGQPSPAGSLLQSFANHREIAAFASGRSGRSVLVSHEGLCCFSAELTQIMATDLAGLDTRVLFYVRPYGAWIVSSYNFDVRTGHNARGFDDYFAGIEDSVSFWPTLAIWGRILGWEKIRVRSLHPADLQGGDLVADCMAALGLDDAPRAGGERANVSPDWWVVEMLRLVAQSGSAAGWTHASLAVAEELHRLTECSAERAGLRCPPARYLSRAQATRMAALYNRDLALLAENSGTRLQPDRDVCPEERGFVPAAEHVPARMIRLIGELATEPENARVHPEAAAFVRSAVFQRLLAAKRGSEPE